MKIVEVDDEKRLVQFYDKRMSNEIEGDFLGDEYKGYVFRCARAADGGGAGRAGARAARRPLRRK